MMNKIWDYIVNDFLSFIGTLSIFGGIAFGLTYFLKKYVDNQLQKNLQGHKREMDKQIESFKHLQQKAYKEFDLYTTKRHEVYPELYKKIEEAYGAVKNLRGEFIAPDFQKFNQRDFEEHLKEIDKLSESDIENLVNMFGNDKQSAISEIQRKMEWVRYYDASVPLFEANNFLIISELYLTETSITASRELLKHVHKYWKDLYPEYNNNESILRARLEMQELLPSINAKFRKVMKDDLQKSLKE